MAGRLEERFDTTLAIRLEHGEGVVRNVSATGIYFVTDIALERGKTVAFTMQFPARPGGPLLLKGFARVIRVEPCDGKHGVGAAVASFEFVRAGEKNES